MVVLLLGVGRGVGRSPVPGTACVLFDGAEGDVVQGVFGACTCGHRLEWRLLLFVCAWCFEGRG
jgi:hypothetical protein